MMYKGSDLDLRSQRPSGLLRESHSPSDWAHNGSNGTTPADSIAVDEVVLACCNCAYDIARFHASPEVRLEHLLHALTRVGAAAETLGELGIRVDVLRRETAVAIAAEIPAAPIDGEAMPHASAALVDVLRRAADHAARRRAAADLHDLLRTLLGGGPGSPTAGVLMQAANDPPRLERWRDAPLRAALNVASSEDKPGLAVSDMSRATADALLGRLDQMEGSLRSLQSEVASERQAVGDLLRNIQTRLEGLRAESLQAAAGSGRSPAVEAMLEAKLGDIDKSVGSLGKRLAGIDKIAAASDAWQELRSSMQAVEDRFGTQTLDVASRISDAFAERLDKTEAGLRRLQEETERHWDSHGERQIALEASVRSHLQGTEDAGKAHARDLSEIYQALVKLGANQQTLGDNFTAWRIETSGDIGIVNNRLQQLEHNVLDLLSHLGNELQAVRQEGDARRVRFGGFKRWLYGTGNVIPAGWRSDPSTTRPMLDHAPKEEEAEVQTVQVEKKS